MSYFGQRLFFSSAKMHGILIFFFFKLTLNYFRPISISISIASVHLMFISACQISATEGVKGPKKKEILAAFSVEVLCAILPLS